MLLNVPRALRVMDDHSIDALIATTPENIAYLCGYGVDKLSHWSGGRREHFAVFPRDPSQSPALVIAAGGLDVAAQDIVAGTLSLDDVRWYGSLHFFGEAPPDQADTSVLQRLLRSSRHAATALDCLVGAIRDLGLSSARIAVDELHIPPDQWTKLCDALPESELVPGYGLFRDIRSVKTPKEICRLRKAAEISEAAFEETLNSVREGLTERELLRVLRTEIARRGGLVRGDSIGAGPRSALAGAYATDYVLRTGDLVKFDFGAQYRFYHCDTARVVVVGEPTDKQVTYHRALVAGEQRALGSVRAGTPARSIFATAVEEVRASGIPHYARQHCGHGIGLEGYDVPLIAPEDPTVLQTGMVINIETPYYEFGWGGMNVEDTVVVLEEGVDYLTQGIRSLRVV